MGGMKDCARVRCQYNMTVDTFWLDCNLKDDIIIDAGDRNEVVYIRSSMDLSKKVEKPMLFKIRLTETLEYKD